MAENRVKLGFQNSSVTFSHNMEYKNVKCVFYSNALRPSSVGLSLESR